MEIPDRPENEAGRLARLRGLGVLDSEAEERFDRITRIAAHAFGTPIALVSLVDEHRQWFKSKVGLDASETSRDVSLCGHAILDDDVFVVEDTNSDPRFASNPLVTGDPRLRFYAGVPLDDGTGHKLGTLCVIDRQARSFSVEDRAMLADLGAMVEEELLSLGLAATTRSLAERENLYASVVGVLAEGLVVIDRRRIVVTFNEAAGRIVGVQPEEGSPMPALPWVDADRNAVDPMEGPVGRTLRFAERCSETLGLEQPDGTYKWFQVSTCPVTTAQDGLPSLAVAALEDITERVQIDELRQQFVETLRDVNEELARSNEDLEQFAYVASHDLQTPVRNITNAAVLLRDELGDEPDEAIEECLGFMDAAAARMKLLIEDLLEYSRVGRTKLTRTSLVSLNDVIDDICYCRSGDISTREATVDREDLPPLRVDPGQIRQLLDNLISNALKYQSPDRAPRVEVSARRSASGWTLFVTDNGLGIDHQFHDRVFDMFRRLHRFEEYEGSGIGLAICRRIVELHGGRIWVETAPDGGSTFAFTIPVEHEDHDSMTDDRPELEMV